MTKPARSRAKPKNGHREKNAASVTKTAWAIQWRSENYLDGKHVHLVGRANVVNSPEELSGCPLMLFSSRKQARGFILRSFGYIGDRKDLRCDPHGWHLPLPVKVEVTVRPA